MKLYVIRHGETEWNIKRKLQGWGNSELTSKGINNAIRLGIRLSDVEFDVIYSSPLKRALDTANIIRGNKNTEIIILDELKEMGFGVWEGMNLERINELYPEEFNLYWNQPHLYKPIDGESFIELINRVRLALEKMLSANKDNILVVSHGVTIKAINAIINEKSLEKFNEITLGEGTSLTIYEIEDKNIRTLMENDTSHFGDL